MQKLLNTLFVMKPDTYLSLEGENIVVTTGETVSEKKLALRGLDSILYFGERGVAPALIGACAERGINLSFFSSKGEFLAGVHGETRGNILLRKRQYELVSQEETCLEIAKSFIAAKIFNTRWIVERAIREYPTRIPLDRVRTASRRMKEACKKVADSGCNSRGQLMKLEKEAESSYYSILDELILHQKDVFYFSGRSGKPPLDPFNTLLSFVDSLLTSECTHAVASLGLDPYAGFLHHSADGQASLTLDLMEELRGIMCDRFVLSLVNNKRLGEAHFAGKTSETIRLTPEGQKLVLHSWQARKKETIRHPFLKEQVPWGLVPSLQALLMARYIRGDLDAYPSFLWK